ncbi:hypothetical protein RDABS01_036638 [Bienertia sinuspersici]
MGYTNLRLF